MNIILKKSNKTILKKDLTLQDYNLHVVHSAWENFLGNFLALQFL